MRPLARHRSCKHSGLVGMHLINADMARVGALRGPPKAFGTARRSVFSANSPFPFSKGERIKVRGFLLDVTTERNPHPALSLGKGEAENDAKRTARPPSIRFIRRLLTPVSWSSRSSFVHSSQRSHKSRCPHRRRKQPASPLLPPSR